MSVVIPLIKIGWLLVVTLFFILTCGMDTLGASVKWDKLREVISSGWVTGPQVLLKPNAIFKRAVKIKISDLIVDEIREEMGDKEIWMFINIDRWMEFIQECIKYDLDVIMIFDETGGFIKSMKTYIQERLKEHETLEQV